MFLPLFLCLFVTCSLSVNRIGSKAMDEFSCKLRKMWAFELGQKKPLIKFCG